PERALAVTSPVAAHVLLTRAAATRALAGQAPTAASTVAYLREASLVPPTLTSTAMRRIVRPQARLMRTLKFDANATPQNLLARVNAGEVSAAPAKVAPPGVPTVDQAAAAADPKGVPKWLLDLLTRF